MQGIAPRTDYEKVLRSVTYVNTSASPGLVARQVSFVVNDGAADSNTAVSTVRIILPRLTLSVTPREQTVASGGTAVFTMTVRNTGNITLESVQLRDSLAPACNRNWSSLAPDTGRTISCSLTNVTADFNNVATVSGADASGNRASAQDTVRVEVENPNIRIVKGPSTQTVLSGESAAFSIFVINTSARVNLGNVEVSDTLAPDCSREGNNSLGNLAAGAQTSYSCRVAEVTAAFTNEITVTGRNLFTGELVSDSAVADVELLDMRARLQADPSVLLGTGGMVDFSLTLLNSGSVPWEIAALESDSFGDLLDGENDLLQDNSCIAAPDAPIGPDEEISCDFRALVEGPPGPFSSSVAATALDIGNRGVQAQSSTVITIADGSSLELAFRASTDSVAPPGRYVTEQVELVNAEGEAGLTVSVLEHSQLGNLSGVGSCLMPQVLAAGESYTCSYQAFVGGTIGGEVRHSIVARGTSTAGGPVGAQAELTFVVYDPLLRRDLLPVVLSQYQQPIMNNNGPCTAHSIVPGTPYRSMIEDREDWFVVMVTKAGSMEVTVVNYVSDDPQLIVYRAANCRALELPPVAFDGSQQAEKQLRFSTEPGVHFIRLVNATGRVYDSAYELLVLTP